MLVSNFTENEDLTEKVTLRYTQTQCTQDPNYSLCFNQNLITTTEINLSKRGKVKLSTVLSVDPSVIVLRVPLSSCDYNV